MIMSTRSEHTSTNVDIGYSCAESYMGMAVLGERDRMSPRLGLVTSTELAWIPMRLKASSELKGEWQQ